MKSLPKILLALGVLLFSAAVLVILYVFNPEETIWVPKCPFYILTGYQCPSCGIQRAIYSLMHFELRDAFMYNPFLVISVPYGVMLVVFTWIVPQTKFRRVRAFCYSDKVVTGYLIAMVVWWVVRNIPVFHLSV